MNTIAKKRVGVIFGTLAFLVFVALVVCLPRTSYAAALGTESPNVYCTYTDSNGKQYDGDKLPAGTYDVSFYLEGVTELSVVQVTSTYSSDVSVKSEPKALLSDEVAGVSSMGTVTNDSNLVFGFVSDADTCSSVTKDGTLLATFSVAFAKDCDAADVISVSTDPNKTFVVEKAALKVIHIPQSQSDIEELYNDGFDDEYALVTKSADYPGSLYLMTCDVSPSTGHSVNGSLVIMTDAKGNTANSPVYGEYTVNVYSDSARTELVGTTTSSLKDGVNAFSIDSLKDGTYYLSISSDYAIARNDATVIVNGADITNAVIPMMACDFNKDGIITGADATSVYLFASKQTDLNYDLNGDSVVTGADATAVYACASGSGYYNGLEIK